MALPFFALGLATGLVVNKTWDWMLPRRPFARGYCEGVAVCEANWKDAVRALPVCEANIATNLIDQKTAVAVVGFEVEHKLGDTSAAPRELPLVCGTNGRMTAFERWLFLGISVAYD